MTRWPHLAAGSSAIALVTFAYRYLSFAEFSNDHFVHLSIAQQITRGALPVRDFVERGIPMMSMLSAAAQLGLGEGLRSELVLIALLFAIAAALTFVVAAMLSRSLVVATLVALVPVLAYPVSYSYPKLLAPAIGCAAAWFYCARPSSLRLVLTALAIAASFLLRHDLGLILGTGVVVMLLVRHGSTREGLLQVGLVLAVTLLAISPFLIWIQVYEGLGQYVADGIAFSAREAQRANWFDAPRFSFGGPGGGLRLGANAIVLLFYLVWLVPVAAAVTLVARWARESAATRALLVMIVAIQLSMDLAMLRDPLDTRMRDVVVPLALLVAYLAGTMWAVSGPPGRRVAMRVAAISCATVVVGSGAAIGGMWTQLDRMRLGDGLSGLELRARAIRRMFTPPDHRTGPPSPVYKAIVEYIKRCTTADESLLTLTFAPELFFYTGRSFAGGQVSLSPGYFASDRDAELLLARVSRERVPLVIMDSQTEHEMLADYPRIGSYVSAHYREAARFPISGEKAFVVLSSSAAATGESHVDTLEPSCSAAAHGL